jgi:anti-sigma regulatory factor (Ser/Thr protein kinase)
VSATEARLQNPIPIVSARDVVEARGAARTLATRVGFAGTDLTRIASAVSEIARNIVEYAQSGEVVLSVIHNRGQLGLPSGSARRRARNFGPFAGDGRWLLDFPQLGARSSWLAATHG